MSNKYLDIAMNKVIKQEVNKVLDKIRAEIIHNRESNTYGEYDKIFELCLLIIDKYKAESEG